MAIFKHPDGSYHRYRPAAQPEFADTQSDAEKEKEKPDWKSVDGARPGIEVDKKTGRYRNTAPTPPPATS